MTINNSLRLQVFAFHKEEMDGGWRRHKDKCLLGRKKDEGHMLILVVCHVLSVDQSTVVCP